MVSRNFIFIRLFPRRAWHIADFSSFCYDRAITRDEQIFPNASEFYPERYLEEVDAATAKRRDPRNYVFGFGRRYLVSLDSSRIPVLIFETNRRCPGANLVESSVWLLIVSMLATLDISKARDDAGNVIEPKVEFNNAVFRYIYILLHLQSVF